MHRAYDESQVLSPWTNLHIYSHYIIQQEDHVPSDGYGGTSDPRMPKGGWWFQPPKDRTVFSNTVVHRSNDPFWGLVICCYSIDMCIWYIYIYILYIYHNYIYIYIIIIQKYDKYWTVTGQQVIQHNTNVETFGVPAKHQHQRPFSCLPLLWMPLGSIWNTEEDRSTVVWSPSDTKTWVKFLSEGYLWLPKTCWLPMVTYGYLWLPMDTYGYLWLPMVTYVTYKYGWNSLKFQNMLVTYGYPWSPTRVPTRSLPAVAATYSWRCSDVAFGSTGSDQTPHSRASPVAMAQSPQPC